MEDTYDNTKISYSRLLNSKLKFRQGKKAISIFHYTSIGGLQGILKSKKLRFTNIKYLNDKDEIVAGLDSMAKACKASDKERESLRSAFMSHGTQTFICCFSLEEDSLPMWNYYTKEINNQGYNIGFDDTKLVESILRNNPLLDGCDFSFGKVEYSKDNDSEYSRVMNDEMLSSMKLSISKLFLTVIKEANKQIYSSMDEDSLRKWEKWINKTEEKKKLSELPIYFYNGEKCNFEKSASGNYLFFIKRDYFKQEHEFRIVITVPDDVLSNMEKEGIYKFYINNGVLVPYLELSFSEDVVRSVTISPTVQSDLVELSIQDFMKYCKYNIEDFSTFIKHSNIPVRF